MMLAPWKEIYTNLDSILKMLRHHCDNRVRIIKTMVFPVIMYKCESRTIKKTENQRINAFELWC